MERAMKHPRPDFERERFEVLDGVWDFEFDDADEGLGAKWYDRHEFKGRINVPYVPQCAKSLVDDASHHPVMWYATSFETTFENTFIVFGAVDFKCSVFVNGMHVVDHEGGYLPFSACIAPFLNGPGCSNRLVVRVVDEDDESQLRGKQYWRAKPDRCWYVPSSGIWQSVWLEDRPTIYIENVLCSPDIDESMVGVRVVFNSRFDGSVGLRVHLGDNEVSSVAIGCSGREAIVSIGVPFGDEVDETNYWSPDNPVLFRLEVSATPAKGRGDRMTTFFGMRKIEVRNGSVLLNNKPFFQRLLLDQGYFPDGLLTGTAEEFERDIELIKELGFNGVRMHQKIENPVFLHLADELGLLVWEEVPSGYCFNGFERSQLYSTVQGMVERDFNHPCIVCWVPLNESWGVRKICASKDVQRFAVSLYHMLKALDGSRLVSTNDGWEQVESDICAVHDYARDGSTLLKRWKGEGLGGGHVPASCPSRATYASGFSHGDEPVLITEFGGVALRKGESSLDAWGYEGVETSEKPFADRVGSLVHAVCSLPNVCGYCYTQFTDVFQEINGLVDIWRKPKVDMQTLGGIFGPFDAFDGQ